MIRIINYPRFRTHAPLLAVLLLALAIRLALWSQPLHSPANDELEYVTVAYDLLDGRGWQFYDHYHWLRAPLYPLFLAGSLWLSRGNLHLAALPNIALSIVNIWLIFLLTHTLQREPTTQPGRLALLAALLAALLLTLGTFASLYMSETLFSLLFTAALLLLLRWRQMRATSSAPATLARRCLLLAAAGACYGLATLTRSLPLAFLPAVVLWIWAAQRATARPCIINREVVAFLLACAFAILPWTLRNCQAYGRCILVETGFSYNVWAFNEPREGMSTIFRTLEEIANPAERADEATRRGMARLREDPAILLRKLVPNWVYLWRVKPIEDRFLLASYYADPPPLLFLLALVFDDLLYVVILLTAVVGFRFAASGSRLALLSSPGMLLALWVAYVVGISMLTHGEARYRHFIFPVLIPYAALGIGELARLLRRSRQGKGRWDRGSVWLGRGVLIAALLATILSSYPWTWLQRGAGRSFYHLAGNMARMLGNPDAAEAAYQQALRSQRTADVWIALGDLRRERGDLSGAESVYRSAWRKEPLYVNASARVGDILRRQGKDDEARAAFAGKHVFEQQVLDWSWDHLDAPPVSSIDIGAGLDFGYAGGMYPAEQLQGSRARWTNGRGLLRLALPETDAAPTTAATHAFPRVLRLRLAAPHPQTDRVPVQLCAAEHCQTIAAGPDWRTITVLLPTTQAGVQVLEIRSPTFTAADGRTLGVRIDRAAIY